MRQFITMNDTIRSISKDQRSEKTRKKRLRNRTLILPASSLNQTMPSWQIPLVRQQSVPRFCDVIPEVRERTWSCSSGGMFEELSVLKSSVGFCCFSQMFLGFLKEKCHKQRTPMLRLL